MHMQTREVRTSEEQEGNMTGEEAYLKTRPRNTMVRSGSIDNARYMNPESLLERAYHLDEQSLAIIHDRFFPVVYRYVHYRLEDDQIVEDISSDVFLRLLDHLHKRKSDIRDLRAWLLGTASNLVNDHLRHKYRKPLENLADHETLATADDPQRSAEDNEHHHIVRKAIQKLTSEQQHVLALRFSQELSIEETAQIMKKSTGAIKVLQFRALASLRKLLEVGEGK
jgi:RNA polymerase sigma-70 factor, ECF subfamily